MSGCENTALLLSDIRQRTAIEGYAFPYSVAPGETIDFFVSSYESFEVTYFRLSDMDDGWTGATPLTPVTQYKGGVQRTGRGAWRNGCYWRKTFSLDVPTHWPSDLYAAELRVGGVFYRTLFIVRPAPIHRSRFLVLASTNTWNAYNEWGGYSRYTLDQFIPATSFMRPSNVDARGDLWLHRWLRKELYETDVMSDQDFSEATALDLHDYAAIILNLHPEYWTREMLDNLETYLVNGGCLLYLGGNGIFEAVRYSPGKTHVVYHDGRIMGPQPRQPFLFRNLNPPRPERDILGVAFLYENYNVPPAPYEVNDAGHWIFSGTGVKNGDRIGGTGIWGTQAGLGGAASGLEMDTSTAGTAAPGVICSAYLNTPPDRGTPPPNLHLLAKGQLDTSAPYYEGQHSSHMTYYDHPGGGFVFSAGSMCFTGSLVADQALQRIVKNALAEAMIR